VRRADIPTGSIAMRPFRFSYVLALALIGGSASLVWSQTQSLADVAKKEEERRKTAPQPAKVYTNKDLKPAPSTSASPQEAKDDKDAAGKDAKDSKEAAKDAKDSKDAKDVKDSGGAKDQKYWSDKLKALREQLDRDKTFADALQNKINSLTTDFINRDDPVQKRAIEADRVKALAELGRLNKAITDDQKAIADLEEEARRAGVPAGWLR
jgi:hypothetical protein